MAHVGQPLGGALVRDNLARFGGPRVPFVVVTLAGLLGVFLPGGQVGAADLAWSLGALALCALASLPWARGWRGRELAVPLGYIGFVTMLVQAQGGTVKSGSSILVLVAVLWVALYCRRAYGVVVVAAASAAQVWLSIAAHQSGALIARKGLWLVIMAGITVAVHQLRDRYSRAIVNRDTTLRQVEALAAAVQELATLHDPQAVLEATTRVAAQVVSSGDVGTRRSTYFTVEGESVLVAAEYDESGHHVTAGWALSAHPPLARAVRTGHSVACALEPSGLGEGARQMVEESGVTHGAWVPVLCDGQLHGVLSVAGRQTACSAHVLRLLVSLARVTELALDNAMAHQELERQAGIDPLTGCLNRRGLAHVAPAYGGVVVLSADLDGLKGVNDSAGHHAGDAALVRFADLLRSTVRPGDVVARVGGDEFLVVLKQATAEVGWQVAGRIVADLHDSPGRTLRVSIGIAAGSDELPFEVVVSRADEAMYEAKRNGGMRAAEWCQDHAIERWPVRTRP